MKEYWGHNALSFVKRLAFAQNCGLPKLGWPQTLLGVMRRRMTLSRCGADAPRRLEGAHGHRLAAPGRISAIAGIDIAIRDRRWLRATRSTENHRLRGPESSPAACIWVSHRELPTFLSGW